MSNKQLVKFIPILTIPFLTFFIVSVVGVSFEAVENVEDYYAVVTSMLSALICFGGFCISCFTKPFRITYVTLLTGCTMLFMSYLLEALNHMYVFNIDLLPTYERTANFLGLGLSFVGITNWVKTSYTSKLKLEYLASTDTLTEIMNRRVFIEHIKGEFDRASRYSYETTLIMLDIDKFKNVNDIYGHEAGDNCLREFAVCVSSAIRSVDIIARWSGEEFVVLCPQTSEAQAAVVAERIKEALHNKLFKINPTTELGITASMGVAQHWDTESNLQQTLKRADAAMFYVKEHGRDGVAKASESICKLN
jgi:diguanylate cyclase (GGDEF)-like protein